ncbi:GNAT family N-acetyltransferase [Oceanicoccus sagamiensis]|uniref:GNAT family N-acetyltransferase n=1 Tax=Oceanicoccus sagamiensis TaxID=716816 RepID=A0A1X9NG39_9GAMM|nr:GNAT family N-acetyltransferase [Oceanicoccus sagamiensis]ARN73917.1 GNAT family N-acetyltransferase [Oceanicoccus sagamiensis]
MQVSFINSIEQIEHAQWNAVAGTDYPFTRYEFLQALELSKATDRESGWQPQHALVYNGDILIAVMPLYLKYHSYGEYVFDWSWADAYQRHGFAYYPKILSAIPFTPATGPRLCITEDQDAAAVRQALSDALLAHAKAIDASSIHILFPPAEDKDQFQKLGFKPRRGSQYHWFNQGFSNFDDFLNTFSSRKRKNLKKERRKVEQQNLQLEVIEGPDISPEIWQRFYYFYQLTYAKRSGHGGYLNQEFFELIAETMAEHIVLVLAYDHNKGGEAIAGAINFRDSKTLYGRYWGCMVEYEFLHFEACYYQGIEYCIANGLQRFDPGAQGEHKIQRGFTPIETWSNHWIAEPAFAAAIEDFIDQDNRSMEGYIEQACEMLPFRKADK